MNIKKKNLKKVLGEKTQYCTILLKITTMICIHILVWVLLEDTLYENVF